jgi:hypothetical protein
MKLSKAVNKDSKLMAAAATSMRNLFSVSTNVQPVLKAPAPVDPDLPTTALENIASHRVLVNAGMVKGEFRNNKDGSFTQVFEYTAP